MNGLPRQPKVKPMKTEVDGMSKTSASVSPPLSFAEVECLTNEIRQRILVAFRLKKTRNIDNDILEFLSAAIKKN